MNSSTSNSRIPYGAVWAVVFLIVIELLARMAGTDVATAFDQSFHFTRAPDYTLINAAIEFKPAPEILVLGSSRARDGIVMPSLSEGASRISGQELKAASYAAAGCDAACMRALVERLVAEDHVPKLVVLGVTVRCIKRVDTPATVSTNRLLLANFATLRSEIDFNGPLSEPDLTTVMGNALPFRISQLRHSIQYRVLRLDPTLRRPFATQNSATGGYAYIQLDGELNGQERLSEKRSALGRTERYVARLYPEGQEHISEAQVRNLDAVLEQLHALRVPVVMVEMPNSEMIAGVYPEGLEARAREIFAELAEGRAQWHPRTPGQYYGADLFHDQSHLNRDGAEAFTSEVLGYARPQICATFGCPPGEQE